MVATNSTKNNGELQICLDVCPNINHSIASKTKAVVVIANLFLLSVLNVIILDKLNIVKTYQNVNHEL